jgi:hypothetical protein
MNQAKPKSQKTCPIHEPVQYGRQNIYSITAVLSGSHCACSLRVRQVSLNDFQILDSGQHCVVVRSAAMRCVVVHFLAVHSVETESLLAPC